MNTFPDNPRLNSAFNSVLEMLEILSDPVKLEQYEKELAARRELRRRKHAAKIARLMDKLTDKADALIAAYQAEGAEINKFYTDRSTGNVAVMLVKRNVWNHAKGRMGTKLVMVYPDGTRTETLERTISIKQEF